MPVFVSVSPCFSASNSIWTFPATLAGSTIYCTHYFTSVIRHLWSWRKQILTFAFTVKSSFISEWYSWKRAPGPKMFRKSITYPREWDQHWLNVIKNFRCSSCNSISFLEDFDWQFSEHGILNSRNGMILLQPNIVVLSRLNCHLYRIAIRSSPGLHPPCLLCSLRHAKDKIPCTSKLD